MGIPMADVLPDAAGEASADVAPDATDAGSAKEEPDAKASPGPKLRRRNSRNSDAASPASARKRPGGDSLEATGDQQPPTAAKKPRKSTGKAAEVPQIVLVDAGEPQVRTWRICSENKVNVRKSMAHDADKVKYLGAGEEFEAEGPYKIDKRGLNKVHWLKLVGEDAGFVPTCSSKDTNKVVATLKRKQSSEEAPAQNKVEYALLIKPNWCQQILEKGKVWEIRGEVCHRRTRFAIGASGTGTLVGEATMVNCLKVGQIDEETGKLTHWDDKKLFIGRPENFAKHRIKDMSIVTYPKVYAWVMDDVVKYKTPVPYVHPQGAIKWIKLDETSSSGTAVVENEEAGYIESDAGSSSKASSSSSSNGEEAGVKGSPQSPDIAEKGSEQGQQPPDGVEKAVKESPKPPDESTMEVEKGTEKAAEESPKSPDESAMEVEKGAEKAVEESPKSQDESAMEVEKGAEKVVEESPKSPDESAMEVEKDAQKGVTDSPKLPDEGAMEVEKGREEPAVLCEKVEDVAKISEKAEETPKSQVLLPAGQAQDELWRVAVTGSVTVRAAKDRQAAVLGSRKHGAIVSGRQEGDWLALDSEPGFVMIHNNGRVLLEKATSTMPPSPALTLVASLPATDTSAVQRTPGDVASVAPATVASLPVTDSSAVQGTHGGRTEEAIQRLQKVVVDIKAGLEEPALQELLESLLGSAGSLGDEPAKALAETKVALVVADLRKHPSQSIKTLASKVRQHWKELCQAKKKQLA